MFLCSKNSHGKIIGVSEFDQMAAGYDRIIAEAQELDNIVDFFTTKKKIK